MTLAAPPLPLIPGHDPDARTLTLSTLADRDPRLGEMLRQLMSGSAPPVLSDVALSPLPATDGPGVVRLLRGSARADGEDVHLEVGVRGPDVVSFLLLYPAPESFRPVQLFPALSGNATLADLAVTDAWAVLSHRTGAIDEPRTVGDRTLDLRTVDLRDGLRIVGHGLSAPATLDTLSCWDAADDLPNELRADHATAPVRVEVYGAADASWTRTDIWWAGPTAPDGLGATGTHATGIGIVRPAGEPGDESALWLWQLGGAARPVPLEAPVVPGASPQYRSRIGRIPLGAAEQALAALVGVGAPDLLGAVPDQLALLALTYEPGRALDLVVAAGGPDDGLVTVGPLQIREVECDVAVRLDEGLRAVAIGVRGVATIYGTDFSVEYRPGAVVEGGLDDPDGVDVGGFAARALGADLPFTLDSLTLRDARVRRVLSSPASTAVWVDVTGNIVLGPVALTEARFRAERPDDGPVELAFGATVVLGRVSLQVDAERTPDGWVLDGVAEAPSGLSLTDLLEDVGRAFGATVPGDLPDVRLDRLHVAYDTATRTLLIEALVDWHVAPDVPVLGDDRASVAMTLTVSRPEGAAQRDTVLTVDWTTTRGGHELAASAWLSGSRQVLTVDLRAPDPERPLSVPGLAADLGLGDRVALPAPDVDDPVFEASALALSWTRPGNELDFSWSVPALGGDFLAEAHRDAERQLVHVCWIAGDDPSAAVGLEPLLGHLGHGGALDELRTTFGQVGLANVVDGVVDLLTFRELGFTWTHDGPGDQVLIQARSARGAVDRTFLMLQRGTSTGLVAGVAFAPGHTLSSLDFLPDPLTGVIKKSEQFVVVEPTHLLVSTIACASFVPPAFSDRATRPSFAAGPTGPTEPPVPAAFGTSPGPLAKGLAVGVRVRLADDPDNPLRRILDLDHLDAVVALGTGSVALRASIPGTVTLDAGGGTSLALTDAAFGLTVTGDDVDLSVSGALDLMLFHKHIRAVGALDLSLHSINGRIALSGLDLPPPPMLRGVRFRATDKHPLYLEAGLQFEPPGLTLGLSGSFHVDLVDQVHEGAVAFVLEIVEAVPQPLYVDFSIDRLDVPTLLEAMTGAQAALVEADRLAQEVATTGGSLGAAAHDVAGGLDAVNGAISHINAVLSEVGLDDARIRWCDSLVTLPDGNQATPGVDLRGRVSIFGWHAYAVLAFAAGPLPALTGHIQAEPIRIGGVVEIWGDGVGLRTPPASASEIATAAAATAAAAAAKQNATTAPAATAAAATQPAATPTVSGDDDWYLKPGGPVLHVSTEGAPFLHADLHARLFGFLSADVHADVTDSGFAFDLRIGAGPVTLELGCHYTAADHRFDASGTVGIHLHGDLSIPVIGDLHLDTDLSATIEFHVDPAGFKAALHGEFHFQGLDLTMPQLTLSVAFSSVEDLAAKVWDHIVDAAEDIFTEIVGPAAELVAAGAKEVAAFAADTGREVEKITVAAAVEVAAIGSAAAAGVAAGATALADEAQRVAQQAQEVLDGAAAAAAAAAAPILVTAEELASHATEILAAGAEQVRHLVDDAAAAVARVASIVADLGAQAEHWVTERLDEARRWAADRLDRARRLLEQTALEVAAYVAGVEQQIAGLLAEIGHLEEAIADLLHDVADEVSDLGRSVVHVFGL